ncbi:MAG: DMP19 family protein [Caulobacter sp.]|nr:DMP19 family protein [Caulobacter sp.]
MSWKAWLGRLRAKPPAKRKAEGYWALIEPYWDAVSIYDGPEVFERQFSVLPVTARHLFAAHWLVSEVCNGGFSQLFFNSTGVLAPEAVEGLEQIGLPGMAAISEEAMAWFGGDYPRDRDERCERLAAFEEAHGEDHGPDCPVCSIDDRFYTLLSTENGGFDEAANLFAKQNDQLNR